MPSTWLEQTFRRTNSIRHSSACVHRSGRISYSVRIAFRIDFDRSHCASIVRVRRTTSPALVCIAGRQLDAIRLWWTSIHRRSIQRMVHE